MIFFSGGQSGLVPPAYVNRTRPISPRSNAARLCVLELASVASAVVPRCRTGGHVTALVGARVVERHHERDRRQRVGNCQQPFRRRARNGVKGLSENWANEQVPRKVHWSDAICVHQSTVAVWKGNTHAMYTFKRAF